MTANVISAGAVDTEVDEPTPAIVPVDPADVGSLLTDRAMGHAGIYRFRSAPWS